MLLAYSDPRSRTTSPSRHRRGGEGRARQKHCGAEPLRVWFPGGAEDPKITLIRVECDGAEYWDARSSTLVHAFGYVKAVTTGEPPHPGANDKVDFTKRAG